MRGDLNDQFQRAQAVTEDEGPRKWLIALIVGLMVMFALVIVLGTIFFIKTFDKLVDTTPKSDSTTSSYSNTTQAFDPFNPSASSQTASSGKTDTGIELEYGTVTGTSYFSSFSGVSFSAPSDWSVTGCNGTNLLSAMSAKDLSASSSTMTCSVTISYQSEKSYNYKSAADALESYKASATANSNSTVVNDNVSASYGGNKFNGVIYKKTMDASYSYYTEILVTEIKGYVMEIYVEADTESDLNSVMGMFK